MKTADSSHFYAPLQRITSLATTSHNSYCLVPEPTTSYIPKISKWFCLPTSKVYVALSIREGRNLLRNDADYGFGVRYGVFSPLLGNGIFTQEGTAWKHSRELLRKQFIRMQYQNLDHFREHVDNLIARLLAEEGVIDLQPLFFSLTLDTTTALLLGQSVYSLKAQTADDFENRNFAENFTIAQEGLAKRFRIAPFHFLYNPPKFRRACKAVHLFVEGYIKEMNLRQQDDTKTEELYGFINQVARESATIEDLRDQLLNILLAGRDTTACCLSWTLYVCVSPCIN